MPIIVSKRSFQDGPVQVPKVREGMTPKPITICAEGEIVVSTTGKTSIYTGGFAQCLGLAITTPDNAGGLVAHIKQMGKKAETTATDEEYFATWCTAIVDMAMVTLHTRSLYVALYKGSTNGTGWKLGLDRQEVLDVLDLRARSYSSVENSTLLFDTEKKKLYIPAGLTMDQIDRACDVCASNQRMTELANDLARGPMPVLHAP